MSQALVVSKGRWNILYRGDIGVIGIILHFPD